MLGWAAAAGGGRFWRQGLRLGGIVLLRERDPALVGLRGLGVLIHYCWEVTYPLQTCLLYRVFKWQYTLSEGKESSCLAELFCSSDS